MRLIDADALKSRAVPLLFPTAMEPCGHIPGPVNAVCVSEIDAAPAIDAVAVVRCGECIHWCDRKIKLRDGSMRSYTPEDEPYVTLEVGINVGSHCTKHGIEDESGPWFWAGADDFCSRGARMDGEEAQQ